MASTQRKSGIPVKSSASAAVPKTQNGATSQIGPSQTRPSSIPIKQAKNVTPTKPASGERELHDEIKRLENEVKEKDSAINDLNEKLMERLRECQVLREENEAVKESLDLSNDEVPGKVKDLERLLNEKETFIEDTLNKKRELERKFEVEQDILNNQHEIEVLSLQQRLEDAHREKLEELETSLKNEKLVSGSLREELKGARGQGSSAEINLLHEELMSTKLRYENTIFDLKQELETEKSEKENLVKTQEDGRKEMERMKEKHKEEVETLKYLVQEKDILINDLSGGEENAGEEKWYSEVDVRTKLEELRRELGTEHERNLELANELWRKKFEDHESADSQRKRKDNNATLDDDDENQDDANETDPHELRDEISDLKEQLREAMELQEEQNENLDIQEKEIEDLKESNKEFEERYTTLYKEMESKWQSELGESEVIEKIKSHYDMEIDRLHGDLEDLQTENSNLKTELNLMANDFEEGHSRVRRPSVTARIDMKAEIEDYKVELATLERDLQRALNQNEILKLENSAKNGGAIEDHETVTNKMTELEQEREMLSAERDEFRAKFEETKKERKKLEKGLKSREEERKKLEEELEEKNKEIALLKEEGIKRSETEVAAMKINIAELTAKCESTESEVLQMRDSLAESEKRELGLKQKVNDLMDNTTEYEKAKTRISTLEEQLDELNLKAEGMKKMRDSESETKVKELENILGKVKLANEALTVKYDKLLSENETKTRKICELEAALSQVKTDFENSEENKESKTTDEIESRLKQRNDEYDSLTKKYEESIRENESKSQRISEMESLVRERNVEYDTLNHSHAKLREEIQKNEHRIADLEAVTSEQKSQLDEMKSLNSSLDEEIAAFKNKVDGLESRLKQSRDECGNLRQNNEDLSTKNTASSAGTKELEVALNKSKREYENLNEDYQTLSDENNTKASKIDKLEKEGAHFRKQIAAFEKKVTMQEREKKGLEEKVNSLRKKIEEEKKEISNLQEKCESYEWKNREKDVRLEAMGTTEEPLNTYSERNQELLAIIEATKQEKSALLAKQAQLNEENKELRDERDALKDERGLYENERDQESSEYERKLETAQKKLKEKDRVLNETKKHCRQLKESERQSKETIAEKEQQCLTLEGKIEELHKRLKHLSKEKGLHETLKQDLEGRLEEKNRKCLETEAKLKQLKEKFRQENTNLQDEVEKTKTMYSRREEALQDELSKQKKSFERELRSVQENIQRAAQIEISRLTQGKDGNEELRKNFAQLSEENHKLKIKLDDMGIAVSREKEEKYKAEKLKDQFRFQVENMKEKLDMELEKMSTLQNERLRGEKMINEERNKLLETLKDYEAKNTALISDIEKASGVLKATKEKYVKLKEKHTSLIKKYTKLNKKKLNTSDVQVGPDTSVDFSLIMEDLQRSKETVEETNVKLRAELGRLREEIGRSEYQVKAVRKANVVLMNQSRCLYQESEEQKRWDEERTKELNKYREMNETLQQEKDAWKDERGELVKQVEKFHEELAKLKRENEEYFLAKNKTEIESREKARECVLHSRQLDKLKRENDFLYQQGRKLQAELDVTRVKSTTTSNPDDKYTFLSSFDRELTKHGEMRDTKDFGTGRFSEEGRFSASMNSSGYMDEVRNFTPMIFNNETVVGDKVIESSNKNTVQSYPTGSKTPGKDTNLHVTRNIINNDFASEKYLGKTYWDTLAFLKKK